MGSVAIPGCVEGASYVSKCVDRCPFSFNRENIEESERHFWFRGLLNTLYIVYLLLIPYS